MRALILLGGMAMALSVLAGEEIQYDVTGLPRLESAVKARVAQPVKVVATKETRVTDGSLEKFGATGLGQ